jgi:pimeloyl-ACP methyl ester carboxylesterase
MDGPRIPFLSEQTVSRIFLSLGFLGTALQVDVLADEPADVYRIVIPARDGRIHWNVVSQEVVRQLGVDIKLLPHGGSLNLASRGAYWTIAGLNLALTPGLHLQRDLTRDCLVVLVDRAVLAQRAESLGAKMRVSSSDAGDSSSKNAVGKRSAKENLGLHFSSRNPPQKRLVVMIHGFGSQPRVFALLQSHLSDAGHSTATFGYRSREGAEPSAAKFAEALLEVHQRYPDCDVTVISHSMGGVVARSVLEDPKRAIGFVDQLIMITPPNHGSDLTRPALVGPAFLVGKVEVDPGRIGEIAGGIAEQVNVSIRDLRPNSDFLTKLNSRPRNPNIRYSILLGDDGVVDPVLLSLARENLAGRRQGRAVALLIDQIDRLETQLGDELLAGRGDGVVSLRSGHLDDVDDVIILPMRHTELQHSDAASFTELLDQVEKRILR